MAGTYVSIPAEGGGGGAVDSVNGQTGVVVLDTQDLADIPFITVLPADGGAGIQAAIDAASAAGGGIVQLLEGSYLIATQLTSPSDMNNVWLRGVGKCTILNSQVVGNAYTYEITASLGAELLNQAASNISIGATSVTLTTIANADNFLEDTFVIISGLDIDGNSIKVVNRVLATGNPGTGVVTLKSPIGQDITSVTITGYLYGLNNKVSDLSVIHTAGASHAFRFLYQTNAELVNVCMNGQDFSAAYALELNDSNDMLINNCSIIDYNVVESFGPTSHGMTINNCYGLKVIDLEINNAVNLAFGGTGAALITNGLYHCNFTRLKIINSNQIGLLLSTGSTASYETVNFIDCIFENSDNENVKFLNGSLANNTTFNNCTFSNSGTECVNIQTGNTNVKFLGCSFINNNADILNIAGVQSPIVSNCFFKGATIGLVLTDCYNWTVTGNTFEGGLSYAIYLQNNEDCVISSNSLTSNSRGIFSNGSNNDLLIIGNSILDNSTAAIILNNSDSNVLITGNNLRGQTVTLGTGTNINSVGNL